MMAAGRIYPRALNEHLWVRCQGYVSRALKMFWHLPLLPEHLPCFVHAGTRNNNPPILSSVLNRLCSHRLNGHKCQGMMPKPAGAWTNRPQTVTAEWLWMHRGNSALQKQLDRVLNSSAPIAMWSCELKLSVGSASQTVFHQCNCGCDSQGKHCNQWLNLPVRVCHKYKAITGCHVQTTNAFFRKTYQSEGFSLNKFSQRSSESVSELVSTLLLVGLRKNWNCVWYFGWY